MPQSIIVYRSPVEAAFWDIFMTSEYTFPLIVSVVVMLVSYMLLDKYVAPMWRARVRRWHWMWVQRGTLIAAALFAVATFLIMV